MNKAYQRLRLLKKKVKMVREDKKLGKESKERKEVRKLKGKKSMVMLARNKDIFKKYDEKTPILLLVHFFNTNPYT